MCRQEPLPDGLTLSGDVTRRHIFKAWVPHPRWADIRHKRGGIFLI